MHVELHNFPFVVHYKVTNNIWETRMIQYVCTGTYHVIATIELVNFGADLYTLH